MGKVNLASLASVDTVDAGARSGSRGRRAAGVTELPIDQVVGNPLNQRIDADEVPDELEAMAQTIAAHGVLQPVVVATMAAFSEAYPAQAAGLDDARWVTLIGNRRLAAARHAGRETIPAVVNDGQIGSMFEVMLVENGHRRDLAPLREAEAMSRVLDVEGISRDELARRIGRSGAYITQRMHLLGLIPALRDALDAGLLSVERGREVGRMSVAEQESLAAAGPPFRTGPLNAVKRGPRARTLPPGDPGAAARSIRALYSGAELDELIRLLSEREGDT